ncbi:MAG: flagellar motor protein MotB [Rickettsiales bacterium]|nr:flagellar motor protein MotB [Rickettsiales bacterium]
MNSKFKINKTSSKINNNWMLSFADLLSLILTFFVLLFATSSIPKKSWDRYKNEFIILGKSSHIGLLSYISKESEDASVNIKKIINPNYDISYIKKLLVKSLDQDFFVSGDVIIENSNENIFIIIKKDSFIKGKKNLELTEAGKKALYQLSPVLGSLNNQINLVYRSNNKFYNMKILNFFDDKIKDVGYKNTIRKIFSAINYKNFYAERITIVIKNYEAVL